MRDNKKLRQIIQQVDIRPSERVYLRRLLRPVQQYFLPGSRVLDAGCGDGKPAAVLAALGCRVTGVDIQPHQAAWHKFQSAGVTFQAASAEKLPFKNGSFDAVWVKDAFHHMEHPERGMSELQRVTKSGGTIVVVEANRYNPVFYVHLTLLGRHEHFSRRAYKRFLHAADPDYQLQLAESRCLPWDAPWLLDMLEWFEDIMEKAKLFDFWLTYQIGVVRGKGV